MFCKDSRQALKNWLKRWISSAASRERAPLDTIFSNKPVTCSRKFSDLVGEDVILDIFIDGQNVQTDHLTSKIM